VGDKPDAKVYPHGMDDFPDGTPTVVVTHRGCKIVLRFAAGDYWGEGPLEEFRLLPEDGALKLGALLRFVPEGERYLHFAREAMRIFAPGEPEKLWENFRNAAQELRDLAGPGRGLRDGFYRMIAANYAALVAEGEPSPVKALAEIHSVTISAASRWLKEARRRGYVTEAGKVTA
jgi:hypothetical protein